MPLRCHCDVPPANPVPASIVAQVGGLRAILADVEVLNALEAADALRLALGILRFGEVVVRVADGHVVVVRAGVTLDASDLKLTEVPAVA